jgi:hypothetical protein
MGSFSTPYSVRTLLTCLAKVPWTSNCGGMAPIILLKGASIRFSIQGLLILLAGGAGSNRKGFPSRGQMA